ncbi:MAG TPA: hypothetical protein P5121_07445 [Caldilineaceae bacterium]|nr:hypothetical protein [Caldilineaceae bacterium]
MVELLVLVSGAVAAGLSVYRYVAQGTQTPQPQVVESATAAPHQHSLRESAQDTQQKWPGNISQRTPVDNRQIESAGTAHPAATCSAIPRTQETKEALQRGFSSSSISLGLASTGLLFFPPLQYASVPALIYMGAPAARQAYDMLNERRRPSRALAETAVLAICLGGGWYLAGSLGFWLYYLARMTQLNRTRIQTTQSKTSVIPHTACLSRDEEEAMVPTATLRQGDLIRVGTSEFVPVDGVIVEGVAWVQPQSTTDTGACRLMRSGDRVMAADLIIAGRLALCVQKAQ